MPKKKNSLKIELVISILSLLVATLATFISIQSNQIAKRQIEAQVVVFDVYPEVGITGRAGGSGESETTFRETIFCEFNLRVGNLGGDVATITGFETEISYKGNKIIVDSEGTEEANNNKGKLDDFFDFHTNISQTLPIIVDSFSEIELPILASFSHPGDVGYYFLPQYYDKAEPITFRYTLKLASGKNVQGPKSPCAYIGTELPLDFP